VSSASGYSTGVHDSEFHIYGPLTAQQTRDSVSDCSVQMHTVHTVMKEAIKAAAIMEFSFEP
jgi:hypothetical protein